MTTDKPHKRVFVIGAGASRAIKKDAPLNDDLLCQILEGYKEFDVKELYEFTRDFYNIRFRRKNWREMLPPIEDVLSQFDFALSEKRPISKKYDLAYLELARRQLIKGICTLLQRHFDNQAGVALMYEFMKSLTDEDAIISLNYDLLVDSAVCRCHKTPQIVDYNIRIRQAIDLSNTTFAYDVNSKIKLYKLHGSLNWLYCPRCQSIDVTMEQNGTMNYVAQYPKDTIKECKRCHVRYESPIIAPTFLKTYNNTFIHQLWYRAEAMLADAREIIFIGYSLPDSDIVLRCMFKRAYYAGSMLHNGEHSQIRVVDWVKSEHRAKPITARESYSRYMRLFKDIDYEDTGFVEYIKRGCKTVREQAQHETAAVEQT